MTVDQQPPRTALARYQAEMKRKRWYYYAVLAVVVVAVAAGVATAWSRGEITHVRSQTAASPVPSVALQPTSQGLQQAWQSSDHTATGTPVWGGTLVTYDQHTVRGRDTRTGAVVWSYNRSDRTVCDAIQASGITLAVYRVKGNCDEVTALDSGTGRRDWTRTLAENANPINGRPAVQVTQYTVLFTTPSVVYAIDPNSGIDRWQFAQDGCTIHSAVLGSAGALISQTCDHPDCTGKKFCGPGQQLLLRDPTSSRNDSDSANSDRIKWNVIGSTAVPVSADQLISAVDPETGALQILDPDKGNTRSTLTLRPVPGSTSAIEQLATALGELVHIGTVTYALPLDGSRVMWAVTTPALPTVTGRDPSEVPNLQSSIVAVPAAEGITVLDGATGRRSRAYPVGAIPASSRVYALGTGFVVAGDTTKVYR